MALQFKEGADVYTADGEKAGTVNRVVIDPLTDEVTHLVVSKGWLFVTEKVVPIHLIEEATEDRVELTLIEDLEMLPVLKERHFLTVYGTEETPYERPVVWYPPLGTAWWRPAGYLHYPAPFGYSEPPYVVQTEKNIPPGTVAMKEGAEVVASDGESVGEVARVFADSYSGRVTHVIISQGLLQQEEKLVPTTWVVGIQEDQVHLAVRSQAIEDLPAYKAEEA
jgi:uncharacterized protein YrrD